MEWLIGAACAVALVVVFYAGDWISARVSSAMPWNLNASRAEYSRKWRLARIDEQIAALRAEMARVPYTSPDYRAMEMRRIVLDKERARVDAETREEVRAARAADAAEHAQQQVKR